MINVITIEPTIHFIFALWASHIALSTFEKEDYIRFAKAICLSASLISVYGIFQVIGFDPLGKLVKNYNHPNHLYALLDNPNIVGNYLCLTIPLFFLFIKQPKYIVMFIITIVALILSHSIISIFCGIIGIILAVFLIYRDKKVIMSMSVIFLIGLWIFIKYIGLFISSFDLRFACWKVALQHIKNNPLFGQGFGIVKSWDITIPPEIGAKWFVLHNDWMELTATIGALGVFLIILIIINCFKNFNYKKDNRIGIVYLCSFVSFLILMFFSFPLEIAPVGLLGLVNWWACEKL